jgi:hypothetical protein
MGKAYGPQHPVWFMQLRSCHFTLDPGMLTCLVELSALTLGKAGDKGRALALSLVRPRWVGHTNFLVARCRVNACTHP